MILDTFLYTIHAILPILLLIAGGYLLGRLPLWDRSFFDGVNRLCFRALFPVTLFVNVYAIEDLSALNFTGVGFILCTVLLSVFLGWLLATPLVPDRKQRGVVVQASYRSSQTVLGMSLVESLGGDVASLAFTSLTTALAVPVYNILAVIILTVYGPRDGKKKSPAAVAFQMATNPLIVGAVAGLICVLVEQTLLPVGADGLPVFSVRYSLPDLYAALVKLGKIATPLSLLALGARLDFSRMGGMLKPLVLGVALRLVICPGTAVLLAALLHNALHLTPVEFPAIVAVCCTPMANVSVSMTAEMGGDEDLCGQVVMWSAVFSMLTMGIFIFVLRMAGLL